MVTARKLDSGQVQVDAKCTDVPGGCKECPRCGGCRTDIDGSCNEARATADLEWADMADAIAGTMLPDACRQRWIDGAVRYGQEWQSQDRNNVDEAMEELYDAINYLLAAGAREQLSAKHAGSFVGQVVELLNRLYWVQYQTGRKEAGPE